MYVSFFKVVHSCHEKIFVFWEGVCGSSGICKDKGRKKDKVKG
jgi:hypothetical protein